MLNAMREGSGAKVIKYVALGFVLCATMGMVFMDVGGFFRGGMAGNDTLAKVGRTKIDRFTFERQAQGILRQQNMTMQEAYRFGMVNNMLDEMVLREAMRQEALEEGLIISREEIAERVHNTVRTQMQPSETAQEALARILRTQGMTENDLMVSFRGDLTNKLVDAPLSGASNYVPKLASEALGRYQAERRDITFFTMSSEAAGKDIHADDETLRTYYEGVKDQYQIPEERTFKVIVLSSDDVKDTVKATDEDVKAAFDERKDSFKIGERRKIEQLVLQDEAKAKEASEAARKGKTLKSIATEFYREPIDVEQTALPKELGDAVFGAEKGTILNPIKTPLGWHVVRVISTTPARDQSYAEVRDDLRKELESDALHEEMESRISKIDEALGSGASLEDAATEQNLAIRTVGPIDVQGNFKQGETQDTLLTALGGNKDLLNSLFELMEGETGDLAEVSEGLYAAFSLETVRPTQDRAFEDVKADLEKKYLEEERGKALNTAVEKAMGELSRGEKTFEQVAQEAGAVVKTARDVSRQSKVAGLNDPVALTRLFDETDLKAIVRVQTDGGTILAKVIDARIPDAGSGKITTEQETAARTQMQLALKAMVFEDIRERQKSKIYDKTLEKIYGSESTDAQ